MLSEAFLNLEKSARNMGLVINQEKTVYMQSGKDTTLDQDLAIGNYVFKRVDNFNPLLALTYQTILDLNAACRSKRTEAYWLFSS